MVPVWSSLYDQYRQLKKDNRKCNTYEKVQSREERIRNEDGDNSFIISNGAMSLTALFKERPSNILSATVRVIISEVMVRTVYVTVSLVGTARV